MFSCSSNIFTVAASTIFLWLLLFNVKVNIIFFISVLLRFYYTKSFVTIFHYSDKKEFKLIFLKRLDLIQQKLENELNKISAIIFDLFVAGSLISIKINPFLLYSLNGLKRFLFIEPFFHFILLMCNVCCVKILASINVFFNSILKLFKF